MTKTAGILVGILMLIPMQVSALEKEATGQKKMTFDCSIKPEMYINISSPIEGVLKSVLVNKSDAVSKGQELAKLDATIELARVEVAQQEALMDNQIYAKGLKLYYAKRKLKRISGLYKENALSAQEQDDAETELRVARTEVAQVKLDKKQSELKLILAKAELEQKTIVSPIDGIVVENYLMPGELVQNQAILQLAKIDPLLVEVVAPASVFGQIKMGMSVEIKSGIPVNGTYEATVSRIDRIIDATNGKFTVGMQLPNLDDKLVGGTKCTAVFLIDRL